MDSELTTRLNKIATNVKELKSQQIVGGDSWVVYRTTLTASLASNRSYTLEFIPDIEGPFVAKAYEADSAGLVYGNDRVLVPEPNKFGLWYRSTNQFQASPEVTYYVYTTKRGRLVWQEYNKSSTA